MSSCALKSAKNGPKPRCVRAYYFLSNPQVPLGTGDDDGTMEEDWSAWRAQFWEILCAKYHLKLAAGPKTYTATFRCNVQLTEEKQPESAEAAQAAEAQVLRKRIQVATSWHD